MTKNLNIKINVDTKTGQISILNSKFKDLTNSTSKASEKLKNLDGCFDKIRGTIVSLVGGFLTIKTAMDALNIADNFKNLEGRLSLVSNSQNELIASTQALFEISRDTRQSFESTAGLYFRLASSVKELGYSQQELADVTRTISQSLIISGASADSANAALVQLGQGLASGTLRGDELNSVLEQSPRLAQMIADGMGITIGEIRKVAEEGKITSQTVIEAVKSQGEAVSSEFEKMPLTVGQATTNVKTSIMELISEFDKATGASSTVSDSIMEISNTISSNKTEIIEFGRDVFSSWKMMATGVTLLGEGVISGFDLIINGFGEVVARAELLGKQGLYNMTSWLSDKINDVIAFFEDAYNKIASFFGAEIKKFDRVDLRVDLGIEESLEKLNAATAKTDEIIQKRAQNIQKYTDSIKKDFDDIANLRTQKIEKIELNTKKGKNTVKAPKQNTSGKGKSAEQIAREKELAIKKELDRQIEYYKAIGDLTNQRLKEKEKETLRLKELGLNNLQIQEYFAKEETKWKNDELKKQLENLERYYELVGEKAKAGNVRAKINAMDMQSSGNYTNEQIADANFGSEQQKTNYDTLNSAMGYDTGISGELATRLSVIDEFHDAELARITEHYALLEDTKANHIAKEQEMDRLAIQTNLSYASAGFDALGGLAKMFYDASGGKNKAALRAYQAMMVGKAIVNTYTAATNAYASAGNPYLGAALAALAIAQGMAQVAQIKAQKFHTGGSVGGDLKSDEVNAVLLKGEYVLNREQTKQLKDSAAAPQTEQGGGVVIVNTLDNSVFEQWANSRNGKRVIKNVISGD